MQMNNSFEIFDDSVTFVSVVSELRSLHRNIIKQLEEMQLILNKICIEDSIQCATSNQKVNNTNLTNNLQSHQLNPPITN